MSAFTDAEALIEIAKRDDHCQRAIEHLRVARFHETPDNFDRLLWLLVENGICIGARIAITELAEAR